ncbi:MAG: arginyltransferase [Methylocystis sp.]
MTKELRDTTQFYITSETPCPYLPGRMERKVFTHLVGLRAKKLNNALTLAGFRRSQTIGYRPACEGCTACISVRVRSNEFKPSRTQQRIIRRNTDLTAVSRHKRASTEQFSLFQRYVRGRHEESGMADMSFNDYQMMIEDSYVETQIIEYRHRSLHDPAGTLVACCLTDHLSDGLSMVYSFYDPMMRERSLGVFMILDHILRTKSANKPYLYLGYWVDGSPKMAYKSRYLPQERLERDGWRSVY